MPKPLPWITLLRQALGLLGVDLPLHLLDEADDIAHAEDARGHALGIERLERLGLLAHAQEHDGLAGDLAHRKRRAAAGIAICLREHDASQVERGRESTRGIHGILARHGIDDEQALGRIHRGIDLAHLLHQRFVDMQAAGGVDDEHVEYAALRFVERRSRDGRRAQRRLPARGTALRPARPAARAAGSPRGGERPC